MTDVQSATRQEPRHRAGLQSLAILRGLALTLVQFGGCLLLAAIPLFALKSVLPFAWNFVDSAVILTWPEQNIGHYPVFYMKIISYLKSQMKIDWHFIEYLTQRQFFAFSICVAFFLDALGSWKARGVALLLLLSQIHVVFLFNGVFTEAVAYCGVMLIMGATLNINRGRGVVLNVILFTIGFLIASFSRFPFALFGMLLPTCLMLKALLGGATARQALMASVLAGAIVAVGVNLPSLNKPFCVAAGNPVCGATFGKMSLEVIAFLTTRLPASEQQEIVEEVDRRSDDLMVRAIVRVAPQGGGWVGITENAYEEMRALWDGQGEPITGRRYTAEMGRAARDALNLLRTAFPGHYLDFITKNFVAFVNPTVDLQYSRFDYLLRLSKTSVPAYHNSSYEGMGEMFRDAEAQEQVYANLLDAGWMRFASAVSQRWIGAVLFAVTLGVAAFGFVRYRVFGNELAVLLGGLAVFLAYAAAMSVVVSFPVPRYVDAGFFVLVLCVAATAQVLPGVFRVARGGGRPG